MARRSIRVLDYQHVLEMMRSGLSGREIARRGIVSRNKASQIFAVVSPLGWIDPTLPMPSLDEIRDVLHQPAPVPQKVSSIEPYRNLVVEWSQELQPGQIRTKLKREEGFECSVGAIKRFLRSLGKRSPQKAVVVLHFEPGEAAQVDFGNGSMLLHPVKNKPTQSYIFVMTLCDSRHAYAEIVWDQTVETWLRCHVHAFEFFGGVPRRIILDNLKSAIIKACQKDPVIQRSYYGFAESWGFQIDKCPPRRPDLKGRVERGVGYVKNSFLRPRSDLETLPQANQELLEWILGEAGNRLHGTTQEVPLRAFAEREKAALQPIPSPRPETVVWATATVNVNCHLVFARSYYSVPYQEVGEKVDIRATDAIVQVYRENRMVALHPRSHRPGTFVTNREHYPPTKVAFLMKTPQWCLRRASDIGTSCEEMTRRLLGDQVVSRLPAAQGILGLAKKFGAARIEAACARALAHETVEYKAIRNILEKGLDQAPLQPDGAGQLHFPFLENPRFGRDLGQMMSEGRS